jgi:hypothetical protein
VEDQAVGSTIRIRLKFALLLSCAEYVIKRRGRRLNENAVGFVVEPHRDVARGVRSGSNAVEEREGHRLRLIRAINREIVASAVSLKIRSSLSEEERGRSDKRGRRRAGNCYRGGATRSVNRSNTGSVCVGAISSSRGFCAWVCNVVYGKRLVADCALYEGRRRKRRR